MGDADFVTAAIDVSREAKRSLPLTASPRKTCAGSVA